MAKRKVGSQTANLTPDQKKSGIDPIYLAAKGLPHTIRKLLMRATTLLQTATRFEVCSQNYGVPKSRGSHFGAILGLPLRVMGEKNRLDVGSVASHRVYY
jgi:hypothetical protein